MESIRDLAISLRNKNLFKAMLQSGDIKLTIEELERNLWSSCLAFQNSALILANRKLDDLWNLANDHNRNRISAEQLHAAKLEDQKEQLTMIQEAVASLSSGTTNTLDTILETINADSTVTVTGMTALLERHETGRIQLQDPVIKFLRAGISRIHEQKRDSVVQIKSWTVTAWEVERGFLLGSDKTSFVRAGRWLGKSVGIIELKDADTTVRYVKIWKNLRSNRIQGFLGASTVDNPPFILVQPSHLTIAEYVKVTAKPNLRRLVLDLMRAIEYLHTRTPPVVHGKLRSAVVNVDDKGELTVGSVGLQIHDLRVPEKDCVELEQSLDKWTAPELLEDRSRSLATTSDIFSVGVIISELIAIIHDRHPNQKFPLLTPIAKECTAVNPSSRPNAIELIGKLEQKLPSKDEVTDFLAVLPSSDNITELTGLQNVDRWRVVPYVCKIQMVYMEQNDHLYVASAPLEGIGEHPLRQLSIEVKCHDQGQEYTTAHPKDGIWTWIELALLRENAEGKRKQVNLEKALKGQPRGFMIADTRYEIIRLPFADSTPRVHRANLDWRNPFVKEARKGDVIALHPKARFPGWVNYMYSAEMHVVTEQ
ncbi:kinase-like domain-containing protein [Lentinula detonsa]|uniref:Kinase-like domain-containing protein n=1 Tax=Lentinula detonsa TaxID=2804962 RepID=A0AA38PZD1_9AGAR|nr:kinase-like domain-containing protein [Lentinula detonsa]